MEDLRVSIDGKYIFFENKIYSLELQGEVKDKDTSFWLKFLRDNSVFAVENGISLGEEMNRLVREISYVLSEKMEGATKNNFIYEFEKKFVSPLILETKDLFSKTLYGAWNFMIEKVDVNKLIFETESKSEFDKWLQTKGSSFIENMREKMFSLVGIGVQTFLSFTGWGQIGVTTTWGILLAYDTYKAINGDPNYFNLIIDLVSFVPGVSGIVSKFVKSASSTVKSATTVEGVISGIAQSKFGQAIIKALSGIGSVAKVALNAIKSALEWLSKKFGLTYLYQIVSKIFGFINNILNKIVEAAGKYSQGKKVIGAKWGTADNVGQAAARAGKEMAVGAGIVAGLGAAPAALDKGKEFKSYVASQVKPSGDIPSIEDIKSQEERLLGLLNNMRNR